MQTAHFEPKNGSNFFSDHRAKLPVLSRQIYFLRLLSTASPEVVKIMLKPQTPWLDFHDILMHAPDRPIHSRLILRNELVLEIDSENWQEVRDGTRRILTTLNQWGAGDSYYLSFSGNRSIHVHVFMDMGTLPAHPDVIPLLQGHDDVVPQIKHYLTKQIARVSCTVPDMQLTGTHLIRMEGGFNEKSHKYCTMIGEVPEEKPMYYDIVVPSALPSKFWNLSPFENEVNEFLSEHYKAKPVHLVSTSGRPFDPEPLKDILKPVFIPGYRHFLVLSISGWLKRHSIPETKTLEIVKALNPKDQTPAKTAATVHGIYRSGPENRIAGLPSLLKIISGMAADGKISGTLAGETMEVLNALNRGAVEVLA